MKQVWGDRQRKRKRAGATALAVCILLCFAVGHAGAAKVYRWVDPDGTVNLSDSLPAPSATKGANVEVFNYRSNSPGQTVSGYGEHVIPFTPTPQGYLVDVTLNDTTSVKMILDTGATLVVISEPLLKRVGQKPLEGMPPLKFVTASGEMEAKSSVIKKIRMGSAVREDVPAAVIPQGALFEDCDGLLGMSFLAGFHLTIDHKARTITLKKD